ncbi:MAG: hypothetical protein ACRCZO_18880 [Cetobacterium sp.]
MKDFIDVGNLERMSEIHSKHGSYNYLLTICMVLTLLSVGTVIFQNTRALHNISEKLNLIATNNAVVNMQLKELERKTDLIFLDKYEITRKTSMKK